MLALRNISPGHAVHTVIRTSLVLRLLLAGGVAALLSACASMSPAECRSADWKEVGWQDGRQGRPRAYLEEHREACGKVGITPDSALYMEGRAAGIQAYCTPDNGRNEGRRGRSYGKVCPPELEAGFLEGHRAGYRVYQAEQRVNNLSSQQQAKQSRLDRATNDDERRRLRNELRDLDSSLLQARNDLYYAERQLRK